MPYSPIFLKIRSITFLCIIVIGVLWISLLCVDMYTRWTLSDTSEKTLLVILLCSNVLTVLTLPVLVLCNFKPYVDAARLMLLLLAHVGPAVAWALWLNKFACPGFGDAEGICRAINVYILMGSWVIPAILITYCSVLAYAVYRHRHIAMEEGDEYFEKVLVSSRKPDPEKVLGRGSYPSSFTPGSSVRSSVRTSPRHRPNLTITIPPPLMTQTPHAPSTAVTPFTLTAKTLLTQAQGQGQTPHSHSPAIGSPLRTSRTSSHNSSLVYGGIQKVQKTPSLPAGGYFYQQPGNGRAPPGYNASRTPTPRRSTFPRQSRQLPPWY